MNFIKYIADESHYKEVLSLVCKAKQTVWIGLAQRLSPRRKGSHWTELNKERWMKLEAKGMMTDLGRAALNKE